MKPKYKPKKEGKMKEIVNRLVLMAVEDYAKTGIKISLHGVNVIDLINKNLKKDGLELISGRNNK